jgi:hypothetical protein
MKVYVLFEEDIVIDYKIIVEDDAPEQEEYETFPFDWGGRTGDKRAWFNESGYRLPDSILVERGLAVDDRGLWYDEEGREHFIRNIDERAESSWSREDPAKVKQERIAELEGLLKETDYIGARIAEGSASIDYYAQTIAKREAWRKELQTLLED